MKITTETYISKAPKAPPSDNIIDYVTDDVPATSKPNWSLSLIYYSITNVYKTTYY